MQAEEDKTELSKEAIKPDAEDSVQAPKDEADEENLLDDLDRALRKRDAGLGQLEVAMDGTHLSSNEGARMPSTDGVHDNVNTNAVKSDANADVASEALPFVIDTIGDENLARGWKANCKRPTGREPSPAPSNSSDEVVVFHGRNKPKGDITSASKSIKTTFWQQSPQPPSSGSRREARLCESAAPTHSAEQLEAGSVLEASQDVAHEQPSTRQSRTVLSDAPLREQDAEQIISTLQEDWKAVLREKNSAKKKSREADEIKLESDLPSSKRRGKRGRKKDNKILRNPVFIDDDSDDDAAAIDDYLANMEAQLNGDEPKNATFAAINSLAGPSLVVDDEEIPDHAILPKRLDISSDDDSSSSGVIGEDLDEISEDDFDGNYSDLDSSELEDELEYTEREQWEDEVDLRRRRQESMADEQIARLIAKQEELGIYGDELILENGEYESEDGVGDVHAAIAGLEDITNFTTPSRARNGLSGRSHRTRRRGDVPFADASALADTVEQYGGHGFDIMDLDRPSLRPTKKGRKGKLPPELEAMSDEDLKGSMASAWDNDRAKKRVKKAEREELRSQGLLGSSGKKGLKADFTHKYPFGITTREIFAELRTFMQDDGQQSRPFPPMDKHDRKALHELADKLNLKSKSVGAGKNRFTVVHKTGFTHYNATTFDLVVDASLNGRLDRGIKYGKNRSKKLATPRGSSLKKAGNGFGSVAAASVRDGEVVGAGAAEIGSSSFGHKLMEKMGWSKGMALGKEGEGRLVPVEQIVKAGRAGLG